MLIKGKNQVINSKNSRVICFFSKNVTLDIVSFFSDRNSNIIPRNWIVEKFKSHLFFSRMWITINEVSCMFDRNSDGILIELCIIPRSSFFFRNTDDLSSKNVRLFKTSANFHDFWPLPSAFRQNAYEGDFWSLCTVTFWPSAHGDTHPP